MGLGSYPHSFPARMKKLALQGLQEEQGKYNELILSNQIFKKTLVSLLTTNNFHLQTKFLLLVLLKVYFEQTSAILIALRSRNELMIFGVQPSSFFPFTVQHAFYQLLHRMHLPCTRTKHFYRFNQVLIPVDQLTYVNILLELVFFFLELTAAGIMVILHAKIHQFDQLTRLKEVPCGVKKNQSKQVNIPI